MKYNFDDVSKEHQEYLMKRAELKRQYRRARNIKGFSRAHLEYVENLKYLT